MNKKGDERTLILYWFVIFVIISITIISGVISFYGYPLDIREKEAYLLSNKIIECIVNEGKLDNNFINLEDKEFLLNCRINLNDKTHLTYEDNIQYYFEIIVNDEYIKSYGNNDFKVFCDRTESKLRVSSCFRNKLFVLENEKNSYLEVLVAIRKVEQNAK